MSLSVLGLGAALPPHTVDQRLASQVAETLAGSRGATFSGIYRKSGVMSRYTVLPPEVMMDWLLTPSGEPRADGRDGLGPTTGERMRLYLENAAGLAVPAATRAIAEAGIGAQEITHLITVSCTGFSAPGVDIALMVGLGLRPTVARTHLGFM